MKEKIKAFFADENKRKYFIFFCAVALSLCIVIIISNLSNNEKGEKIQYKSYNYAYFDTVTTIVGCETSEAKFADSLSEIYALIGEYHKLYDIYHEYDGINNLCTVNKLVDGKHQVVKVDRKIIDMLLMAKEMYTLTGGRTNVAMGSVLSIWHDYRTAGIDKPWEAELPPMDKLTEAAQHTDINNLIIDEANCTVYLADPEMKLDVGAFAKGYAVEMVAKFLEEKGKNNYVINIGGNIRTIGTKADGSKWKTGIENPAGEGYIEYIGLESNAIVTSGSYQRYYVVGTKEYHHIIDKETLMPADKGLLSVSVICKNSGLGDALSTALFCMSIEDGIALINSLEDVEAMWVDDNGVKHFSDGFSQHFYQ